MTKKHLSGFVPVNYKMAGKTMLVISALIFITRVVEIFTNTNYISNLILFIAITFTVVGIYLVFILSDEE